MSDAYNTPCVEIKSEEDGSMVRIFSSFSDNSGYVLDYTDEEPNQVVLTVSSHNGTHKVLLMSTMELESIYAIRNGIELLANFLESPLDFSDSYYDVEDE